MLNCLEKILLFGNLHPIPAASPFFLLLVGISIYYSVRPCWYCSVTLLLYYAATSPLSPFVESAPPVLDATAGPATPLPTPIRSWVPWNHGRIFDPQLTGYLPIVSVDSSIPTETSSCPSPLPEPDVQDGRNGTEADEAERGGAHEQCTVAQRVQAGIKEKERLRHRSFEERGELPAGYYDLRWTGLGLVLDMGWRRTDEGMAWEGEVGNALPPPPRPWFTSTSASASDSAGNKRGGIEVGARGGDEATTVDAAAPRVADPPEDSRSVPEDTGGQAEVKKENRGGEWSRVSFAGDL